MKAYNKSLVFGVTVTLAIPALAASASATTFSLPVQALSQRNCQKAQLELQRLSAPGLSFDARCLPLPGGNTQLHARVDIHFSASSGTFKLPVQSFSRNGCLSQQSRLASVFGSIPELGLQSTCLDLPGGNTQLHAVLSDLKPSVPAPASPTEASAPRSAALEPVEADDPLCPTWDSLELRAQLCLLDHPDYPGAGPKAKGKAATLRYLNARDRVIGICAKQVYQERSQCLQDRKIERHALAEAARTAREMRQLYGRQDAPSVAVADAKDPAGTADATPAAVQASTEKTAIPASR